MLVLYDTYGVHDKGMESAGTEGAYCHGQRSTPGLHVFPVRVRIAAKISEEFPRTEGAECTRSAQKLRLTSF
jgi:hypothetical protein